MSLRTKLFATVGGLLLIYIVLILFVPTYFVLKDVHTNSLAVRKLIIQNSERLTKDEEGFITDIFNNMQQSLNSFMIAETFVPGIQNMFKENAALPAWSILADATNYNPQFGLFQIQDKQSKQVVVLSPSEATLFTPSIHKIDDTLAVVDIQGKGRFLGVAIPYKNNSILSGTYYILLNWNEASSLAAASDISIAEPPIEYINTTNEFTNPNFAIANWSKKNILLQLLLPFIFDRPLVYQNKNWQPAGIAHFTSGGLNKALLTQEIVLSKPLFDAQAYYKQHLPSQEAPPVANAPFFLVQEPLKWAYLVNTLAADQGFFSVGIPIDPLARDLARWSNKMVVLRIKGHTSAYDKTGQIPWLDKHQLTIFDADEGTIVLGEKNYFFANLAKLQGGEIAFYVLMPLEEHDVIAKKALSMSHATARKISLQLIIISIFIAILIFFAISRLAVVYIIKPLASLTKATDLVVSGDYHQIDLPATGKRKDEVARLILDFEKMVTGLREKEKIRGVLNKIVSKEIADEILHHQVHLGGQKHEMTILFGDIRNFTHMTEHLDPCQTIELLNACMTRLTAKADQHRGIVDKYVGDEIMVLYGVPLPDPDHPVDAVKTAIEMQQAIRTWNQDRKADNKPEVNIGIGIHSGVAVAGNMGAENRLNYTVVGSTVNIASRLCSAAKPGQILLSEQTAQLVQDKFKLESLEPISLKGLSELVKVYQVVI